MSADPGFLVGLVVGSMLAACVEFTPRVWPGLKDSVRLQRLRYTTRRVLRRAARNQRDGARRLADLDRYADQSRPAHRRSTTE